MLSKRRMNDSHSYSLLTVSIVALIGGIQMAPMDPSYGIFKNLKIKIDPNFPYRISEKELKFKNGTKKT